MSFEVRSNSPMDDDWQARDKQIEVAAGRASDFAGAGVGPGECIGRDHGWYVKTFDEAREMRDRIAAVPLVNATFRESSGG